MTPVASSDRTGTGGGSGARTTSGQEAGPGVVPGAATGARARVLRAFTRIDEVDRPEVWTLLLDRDDVLAAADAVDARVAGGEPLPLAGVVLAVKDNVDVAGTPTTAGCPSYALGPDGTAVLADVSAPAVQRLVDAGAVVVGKTNLDQFATGLVGTRSPYGAVRHPTLPERVSGGSSSGSAVAVALGIADVGIGTDTAGSGRVPAAFCGLVGIKTTVGIVPTQGVVPACRSYDVVTTFTRDLALGTLATAVMAGSSTGAVGRVAGPDGDAGRVAGPGGGAGSGAAQQADARAWPADVALALRESPVVAVPRAVDLAPVDPVWRAAFDAAVQRVEATGARVREIDLSGMLAAARLLYDGALVAERYESVGAFLEGSPPDADPTVSSIVLAGRDVPAAAYVADRARLDVARRDALAALEGCDVLLLPMTTEHPTIAQVHADPVRLNARLGTYTNFVNLLDLAAVAVPCGRAGDGPFGVTVVARAFDDQLALDLAGRLLGEDPGCLVPGVDLLVVGAHLRGQPLHGELEALGARFAAAVRTSDAYRLVALDTVPRKPGLVRVGPGAGAPIAGEVYRVSTGALGRFLAALPAPMSLGQVELDDGSWVVGFGCTGEAGVGGVDVTDAGGWLAALERGL